MLIQTVTISDVQRPVYYCKHFTLKRIIVLVDKVVKEVLNQCLTYCKTHDFMVDCEVNVSQKQKL